VGRVKFLDFRNNPTSAYSPLLVALPRSFAVRHPLNCPSSPPVPLPHYPPHGSEYQSYNVALQLSRVLRLVGSVGELWLRVGLSLSVGGLWLLVLR
jgi:hypothetical protein